MKKAQLILVVEDNGMLESMLVKFIVKNFPRATFMIARSAGEGLDIVTEYQPNVVIIDMDVENMHGKELSREITHKFPIMPCIFMSGNYREEIKNGERTLIFLEDSYHLEELKKEINKVLRD
jgi:CheY-like chemotaxis protein